MVAESVTQEVSHHEVSKNDHQSQENMPETHRAGFLVEDPGK